jgi:hypothetical protein
MASHPDATGTRQALRLPSPLALHHAWRTVEAEAQRALDAWYAAPADAKADAYAAYVAARDREACAAASFALAVGG